MEETKNLTLIRVAISNAAIAEAWLRETPASLTLRTPNAAVQVQIENFSATDARQLPNLPVAD